MGAALHRPTIFPVPALALKIGLGEFSEVMLASQRVVPRVALDSDYAFKYPEIQAALDAIFKH
jgi:NAD dependent epimerase/dehydratase family enzyme